MQAEKVHHDEVAKVLALNGADLEMNDQDGFIAFSSAAAYFGTTIMRILADMGTNIEAQDTNGCTALMRAVMAKK